MEKARKTRKSPSFGTCSTVVKSSQVQISKAAAPASFGAPAGARDREGAARRNWHGWIAPSLGFILIKSQAIVWPQE